MDPEEQFFQPPPEAPVFTPTPAEFAEPLNYIAKIRPIIEKTGICKIIPPEDWRPPFAVDVESFRFVPRVQKLNELEATTRVKIIFLNKLFKFWDLQGVRLKVPTVGRKLLDFHKLHKSVQECGGFELVALKQRWSYVATEKMGLSNTIPGCNVGNKLKSNYEKYLYPYDLFEAGVTTDLDSSKTKTPSSSNPLSKSPKKTDMDVDYSKNNEMKRLKFFSAGKRVPLPSLKQEDIKEEGSSSGQAQTTARRDLRDRSTLLKASYLENDICRLCGNTDSQEEMLTCSVCGEAFHKHCLLPPVTGIITGDWRCPRCVAKEYKKPLEVYGFAQSANEYTLASFGLMADKFKEEYFNKSSSDVKCKEVEREFWRLTNSLSEDVTIQYGADIHALTNGSGFPTEPSPDLTPEDEMYIDSKWNLNKLPVLEQSVLQYVSGDVSGMKVPWCYVGMCFSCFCWHIEDHWSYSINYLHWGEPKTWYGVPSSHAEALEQVMQSSAPELFEESPDLLHHITTIMNPNSLMSHGIPVVRTDQYAGQFIVTCPRAYHAGFNQGYNFAEAVNFCPSDWLPMGRACIKHYKKMKRHCVFSHEELICKMAADADRLRLEVAVETHREVLAIVNEERRLRKRLLDMGVTKAERESFELLSDDERQCGYCKTTCFLSSIVCLSCKSGRAVCIEHVDELCSCAASTKCLMYRYTLDEFPSMIRNLQSRVHSYERWLSASQAAAKATGSERVSFAVLKHLSTEARENHYPETSLVRSLHSAVKEADRYSCLVKEVVNRKARTRRHTELSIKSAARRLSMGELKYLLEQLDKQMCIIHDADLLQDLYDRATKFTVEAKQFLTQSVHDHDELDRLYQTGLTFDLELEEVCDIGRAIERIKWLDEVSEKFCEPASSDNEEGVVAADESDIVTMDELKSLVKQGRLLASHAQVEKVLLDLEVKVKAGEHWEEKAEICLQAKPKHILSTVEAVISESSALRIYLPRIEELKEAVRRARDWKVKAGALLKCVPHPSEDQLRAVLVKANSIPVRLELTDQINSRLEKAEKWKDQAAKEFLKPDTSLTLLDVLVPQTSLPISPKRRPNRKTSKSHHSCNDSTNTSSANVDCRLIDDDMYQKSVEAELELMKALRLRNSGSDGKQTCRCNANPGGAMFLCELCKEWLHFSCSETEQCSVDPDIKHVGLLCSRCMRSRRPHMDVILKLLVMLESVPLRLSEGEALQILTERVISWQSKVRLFLDNLTTCQLQQKFDAILAKHAYILKLIEAGKEHLVQSMQTPDHDYMTSALSKEEMSVFTIPDTEPDADYLQRADCLILEGQLIEVSVLEMQPLWKFYQSLQKYVNKTLEPSFPAPKKPKACPPLASPNTNVKKEKVKHDERVDSVADKKPLPCKRTRSSSHTNGNTETKKRRRRKNASDAVSAPGHPSTVEESTDSDGWGDYDEACAVRGGCQLPDDEAIQWIQCDGCELWFHFVCVNVRPDELVNDEYICDACEEIVEEYKANLENNPLADIIQPVSPDRSDLSEPSSPDKAAQTLITDITITTDDIHVSAPDIITPTHDTCTNADTDKAATASNNSLTHDSDNICTGGIGKATTDIYQPQPCLPHHSNLQPVAAV